MEITGGSLFRQLRTDAGLRLEDCAEIAHFTNLSRMENGKIGIGARTAKRMAKRFPGHHWHEFIQVVTNQEASE